MAMFKGGQVILPFYFNQTDLLAGTSQFLSAPMDGDIEELEVVVQGAVTTGGAIGVKANGQTVVGLGVTVADGAGLGTVVNDVSALGEPTSFVLKGKSIEITAAASFATAGAVNGWVRLVGAANSNK